MGELARRERADRARYIDGEGRVACTRHLPERDPRERACWRLMEDAGHLPGCWVCRELEGLLEADEVPF